VPRQAAAISGEAPGQRHEVELAARPGHHELAVQHHVDEVLAQRSHDFREVPGERSLLAALQAGPTASDDGDAPLR
jgi:hypothetical protein